MVKKTQAKNYELNKNYYVSRIALKHPVYTFFGTIIGWPVGFVYNHVP